MRWTEPTGSKAGSECPPSPRLPQLTPPIRARRWIFIVEGAITIGIGVITLALSRMITRGMRGIR